MKNVYFVQVDISARAGAQNAYLPYAAGILAAAAWESEIVKREYCFKEFIFMREKIESVIERVVNPAIFAFSNYCWNTEYNKALAKAVKEKYPQCITIFGGHNVPNDFSFLEQFPYIDYLIHGEGEESLRLLMEALADNGDLRKVPNISLRTADGDYVRTETVLPTGLDYPSPYLEGWFDDLMNQHPEITFNAILETSRGCPHRCAYCDWGLLKSKVRLFPIKRVKAEIKWFSEKKIAFLWGADANFGLFKRDLEIADALVEVKVKNGLPERMRMNYAKTNFENVFSIIQKFETCNFDRTGATLSFQSLSPEVLKNIGRSNSELEFYKNLLAKYNKENMKAYSELILGLPGETYESFIAGIGKLFEIGQHFVFEVYPCILLPNSVLGQKETIQKFGIQTVDSELFRPHYTTKTNEITEYYPIVYKTNTMDRDMWVRSLTFADLVKALHASGFLRIFAIYLYYEKQVPYEKFYDGIFRYFENNPTLYTSKRVAVLKEHETELATGTIHPEKLMLFNDIWAANEYVALSCLMEFDTFYEDVLPYLKSFEIEEDIFCDLMLYQKAIMRRPQEEERVITLQYDVHGFISDAYINRIHPLQKRENTLRLRDSRMYSTWEAFGKYVLWYGRMGWASCKDDIREEEKGAV